MPAVARGARVQVACFEDQVIGCYSLNVFQVQRERTPGSSAPDAATLPAIALSHVGVDSKWQRQNVGTSLVLHALDRSVEVAERVGAQLVLADAREDRVDQFFGRLGF